MEIINDNHLKEIKGGGISWKIMAGISALGSFFIGIIDGLINPQKCNG